MATSAKLTGGRLGPTGRTRHWWIRATAGFVCERWRGIQTQSWTGDRAPHCRVAFPWHAEETWDRGLLDHYRRAISLRHRYPVLRTGAFKAIYAAGDVYGFCRVGDREEAVVILNGGTAITSLQMDVSDLSAETFIQAWPCDEGRVHVNRRGHIEVTLPARDALVLVSEK